jgi:hypothetical protein
VFHGPREPPLSRIINLIAYANGCSLRFRREKSISHTTGIPRYHTAIICTWPGRYRPRKGYGHEILTLQNTDQIYTSVKPRYAGTIMVSVVVALRVPRRRRSASYCRSSFASSSSLRSDKPYGVVDPRGSSPPMS